MSDKERVGKLARAVKRLSFKVKRLEEKIDNLEHRRTIEAISRRLQP